MAEGAPLLRSPTEGRDLIANYYTLGLTLGRHPPGCRKRLSIACSFAPPGDIIKR